MVDQLHAAFERIVQALGRIILRDAAPFRDDRIGTYQQPDV